MTGIGIVGTGPSALYTLQGLLRSAHPVDVTLFEAGNTAGMGIPYNPANTHPSMLANIASIELPPLGPSLEDWLHGLPDGRLASLGIAREGIGPRAFFPRIVLGAYFAAGLERMLVNASASGHSVRVLTRHRVEDVIVGDGGVTMVVRQPSGDLLRRAFRTVVIATGHRAGRQRPSEVAEVREAYPAHGGRRDLSGRIGILGTSLSGIDVAVATASRLGAFRHELDGMTYHPADDAPRFSLTLMSRGGRLPEADFYCPIPYQPLSIFTEKRMQPLIAEGQTGLLDRAFALFAQELALADPAYAAGIDLANRSAADFHKAYFAARLASDPFDWAARNLAEVRRNAAAHHTVAWRYAILRMHETFALAVPHFTPADRRRFAAGLKGVFVDNYAAVPPESIERLLALHRAGVLDLVRLGSRYATCITDAGIEVTAGKRRMVFDHLVDARGQSALGIDDLPFPTLRLSLKANRLREQQAAEADRQEVEISDGYRLAGGLNPLDGIYFLSLPFLLARNPFIQGLTSAHEMGEIVSSQILDGRSMPARQTADDDRDELRLLRNAISTGTRPLFCLDSGAVVLN